MELSLLWGERVKIYLKLLGLNGSWLRNEEERVISGGSIAANIRMVGDDVEVASEAPLVAVLGSTPGGVLFSYSRKTHLLATVRRLHGFQKFDDSR
jgi:hypothetical protein